MSSVLPGVADVTSAYEGELHKIVLGALRYLCRADFKFRLLDFHSFNILSEK